MDSLVPAKCRNKVNVASQVLQASQEGLYPGWDEEQGSQGWPRPIFDRTGNQVKWSLERVKRAEKALGVKLVANSTWLFPHFDCYIQVSFGIVMTVIVFCNCT